MGERKARQLKYGFIYGEQHSINFDRKPFRVFFFFEKKKVQTNLQSINPCGIASKEKSKIFFDHYESNKLIYC